MASPMLATKLYRPPPRPDAVVRPRLIARLNEGVQHSLTLISAPAGFGKTTLLSSWLHQHEVSGEHEAWRNVAWLSLDAADSEPTRFLSYLIAALQTIAPQLGAGVAAALQTPQPPPVEALLTALLNEIAAHPNLLVLVLDDYHLIEAGPVDHALTFLLDHLPPQLRLVIATREDPNLPLARYRARSQLTELRAADVRFTPAEAAEFLTRVMELNLSEEAIAAIAARTEGWVAGLHLAALALQGQQDPAGFITTFTGSHHFILDYLVEEVLQRQPEHVQRFLLRTAILNRLCGPLCDAVLGEPAGSGQTTLEMIDHANLFIVPLDSARQWYRYHHLFRELLLQRLDLRSTPEAIAADHTRASQWFEDHDLLLEAFQHAAAANDIERAERLIGSKEMGLHLRSVAMPILDWLASLPKAVLDARPRLWVRSATLALMGGQTTGVEEKLQAAERALENVALDDKARDLIGQMACARATLALTRYDPDAMMAQAQRALEYLHPDNLPFRFTANWALAMAWKFKGDRAAAARACQESIAISQRSGDIFSNILARYTLGDLQELDNQLHQAAETYRLMIQLSGDHPQPNAGEVHLGLARIYYQWNDLEAAERHGQESLRLVRQYDTVIDRYILSEVFLARLKLARGDLAGAAELLAQTEQEVLRHTFTQRMPEVAAAQVLVLLREDDLAAAAQLAWRHDLPLSQARVHLAQRDPAAALALLEPLRRQMEAKGWQDERLKVLALQAVALQADGKPDQAADLLREALALADPGGCIRIFVDEGEPMRRLLTRMRHESGSMREYIARVLAAFPAQQDHHPALSIGQPWFEPLSPRELEILHLIAQGLSNRAIGARLTLALDTVKGHNRRLFDKLQVQSRTEAIARARELGLL